VFKEFTFLEVMHRMWGGCLSLTGLPQIGLSGVPWISNWVGFIFCGGWVAMGVVQA